MWSASGAASYGAWWEIIPGPSINISNPVSPGDHMHADVSEVVLGQILTAATGLDTWARDQAAPADQEITVIRQLISRIKGDISGLSPDDRARIDAAVAVVRKHRAVSIGMPRLRPAAQSLTSETEGQAS